MKNGGSRQGKADMFVTDKTFRIADREIGPGHTPFIIAEISGNHNGDINRAFAIMEAAARAGADAVKLQTYTADTITIDYRGPGFVIDGGPWKGRALYELYQEASTPWEWHKALFAKGRELGITVFSTPFDDSAVDFLESLEAPAYKIASFEATHLPLLRKVARTGKPVVVSTGMANVAEIEEAVSTLRSAGCSNLLLLHCISAYPAPAAEANLRTIPDMAERFGVAVGLSDHTMDDAVAVAAVALGAVALEKHCTLRRSDGGPDSGFSLEPEELERLVRAVRTTFDALGQINYQRTASERDNAIFRRSIYAVADIAAGEKLTEKNLRIIRPGFGLEPRHFDELIGRAAARPISRGTPMAWDLVG
jgi:N-acetylneuraminate synthase